MMDMDMEQQQQALVSFTPPDGTLVCGVTDAALAELLAECEGLEATDAKSSKVVSSACGKIRGYRVAVEQRRKDLKAPALNWGKRVDAEAKRVTGLLVQIESPLKASQSQYKEIKEAEKRAREEAERQRVAAIHVEIAKLGRITDAAINDGDVARMQSVRDYLIEIESSLREKFEEFFDIAAHARVSALDRLGKSIDAHEKIEADRVRLEEERKAAAEEAERMRVEREAVAAERRAMEVAREAESERMRAEREAIEVERAKLERDAREAKEAEHAAEVEKWKALEAEREAEAAQLRAEKDAAERRASELEVGAASQLAQGESDQRIRAEAAESRVEELESPRVGWVRCPECEHEFEFQSSPGDRPPFDGDQSGEGEPNDGEG